MAALISQFDTVHRIWVVDAVPCTSEIQILSQIGPHPHKNLVLQFLPSKQILGSEIFMAHAVLTEEKCTLGTGGV